MRAINWRTFVLLILAIPVVTSIARRAGSWAGQRQNAIEAANSPASTVPPLQVVVSRQDSEGATAADLGPVFLKNFETYTVERMTARTQDIYKQRGIAGAVAFSAESNYVELEGAQLAVVRLRGPEGSTAVVLAGILGTELVRVSCVSTAPQEIPITFGPCGQKVREVFNGANGR